MPIRNRAALIAALALLLLASPARAQTVFIQDISASTTACVPGTPCGSVGTIAQLVVPAAAAGFPRQQLTIANSSAPGGNTVSCGYSPTITIYGIGTFAIQAGAPPAFWPKGTAPGIAIYCVASGAATLLQIALGN